MAHICVITTIHKPKDTRVYYRCAKTLQEEGHQITLVCPWAGVHSENGIKVQALSYPASRWVRPMHSLRTLLAAIRCDAALYYFHDLDFLPLAPILRFGKRRPVIYDVHENYHLEVIHGKDWLPPRGRRWLSWIVDRAELFLAKRLDGCVVVVPFQHERFGSESIPVEMVRNFADWEPRPEMPHEENLICIGTISSSYGQGVLLDIGRVLKSRSLPYKLIVADKFMTERGRKEFTATVRDENLPIVIHPLVPPGEIDELLSKAKIGLSVEQDSPEKRVGLPTKLFEYMAMGLPVISSDLPSSRSIVETAGCGVCVAPNDAEAFVQAAHEIMTDDTRCNTYREAGFEAITSLYNWSHERTKLHQFVSSYLRE